MSAQMRRANVVVGDAAGSRLTALEAENAALAAMNAQLQRALRTRIVLEQAKGAISARLDITPDAAFELLRRLARSQRRELHDLAAEVVQSRGVLADAARKAAGGGSGR